MSNRPRALVTGASSGIGEAFVDRLSTDGYDVVLVARRRDRLDAIAERARGRGAEAQVVAADLADAGALREVEQLLERDASMAMLVNNAGFAAYMPFIQLPPDRAEEQIRLHVVATVRLTRAALPGMVARKRGAVVNVSSGLAFSGAMAEPRLPKRATYAASKSYLVTFSEILRSELAGTGVRVQALCPGIVKTELHAGMDTSRLPPGMEAADVVQASLAALEKDEPVVVPFLEDPTLLAAVDASRGALFGQMSTKLAARYKR
jgi:short-subunit dehydrogenase